MAPSPQHSARKLSHRPSLFPAADPRFTFHASRFTVPLISILLALFCLAGTACGITTSTGKIIFDDPRGTVSLQTMSDRSIQANHPINLEPDLLAQLLKGIEIQDEDWTQWRGLQKLSQDHHSSVPVFSDDQIRFLAPLLAEGLGTAAQINVSSIVSWLRTKVLIDFNHRPRKPPPVPSTPMADSCM